MESYRNLFVCLSVCVCLLPCNLGGYFVLPIVEPMAGNNTNPSDKELIVAILLKCHRFREIVM